MANYTPNPSTVANLRSVAANNIGKFFSQVVMMATQNEDVFGQWEGKAGTGSVVAIKDDLSKGRGDTVYFPVIGSLGGDGIRGDGALEGNEDYLAESNFNVVIDETSNAVSYTSLRKSMSTWGMSLEATLAKLSSEWLGQKRQNDILMYHRRYSTADNTYRPEGKARNVLTSYDTFSTSLIEKSAVIASQIGVVPARTEANTNGAKIEGFLFFGPNSVLNSLLADGDYKNTGFFAQDRGASNTLMRGGYVNWNGNNVYHWNTRDGKHYGPLNCPLTPKARLGAASSGTTLTLSGSSAITVYGSGVAQATLAALPGDRSSFFKPFQWFPGYDYLFTSFQQTASDSAQYYAWLIDTTNKRVAFVRYQGSTNNGIRIQINAWTAAGADDSAGTGTSFRYIGGVNGTGTATGLDSNVTTRANFGTVFNVGSTWIIPATKWGTPLGWSMVLGDSSILRCYGDIPVQQYTNERDGGRFKATGIISRYGQGLPLDVNGKPTYSLLLETAVRHPGIDLPDILDTDIGE
jgi:hypothetical protein